MKEALEREVNASSPPLPEQLNCQKCGHVMPVKWKPLSKRHSAYRGESSCAVCKSSAVHMVGDSEFLEEYATQPESLLAEKIDIFGKDAQGNVVHVYSSDKPDGTQH